MNRKYEQEAGVHETLHLILAALVCRSGHAAAMTAVRSRTTDNSCDFEGPQNCSGKWYVTAAAFGLLP